MSAKNQVTCSLEALSYDQDINYSDVVNFINTEDLDLNKIGNPDLYVYAYKWLNTPYRYGGNSKSGIDCSRFVMKIYQEALGLDTKGTSSELYRQGFSIDKSQLQEGDLVFFKTRGSGISHVGIYLQDGKFVHSSTSKGVIVSSLDEAYWQRTYYKAARYFVANPFR